MSGFLSPWRGKFLWWSWLIALCFVVTAPLHAQTMSIPGQFAVSPSGAATYTIPIQVPPGVAGMEPKLALVYNSQAGNGPMGLGWSLSGLSVITRCPRTMAQEGEIGGVNLDANDRFCLDGQRLILINGEYGSAGSEYRTELDGFARISYDGKGFVVRSKAGLVSSYGNTEKSRIEPQGVGDARLWAIDKINDVKNNVMTFFYEEPGDGDFRIKSINYGGDLKTGTNPSRSVVFEYEVRNRPDALVHYLGGGAVRMKQRLIAIKSTLKASVGTKMLSRTALTYAPLHDYGDVSRIQKIDVCAADSTCLPSVSFDYIAPTIVNQSFSKEISDWGRSEYRWWVDTAGNGKSSYCRPAQPSVQNEWSVWVYPGNQMTCISPDPNVADVVIQLAEWGTVNSSPGWWIDFNGDGNTDFCKINGNALLCFLSGSQGLQNAYSISAPVSDWGYADRRWWIDFNGDGLPDYCRAVGASSGAGSNLKCSLSKGDGFIRDVVMPLSDWGFSDRRWWVDFNGDGLVDYCRAVGDEYGVNSYLGCSLSTGSALSGEYTIFAPLSDWGYSGARWLIDFNGDGKADYCRSTGKENKNIGGGSSVGETLTCSLSTGVGFATDTVSIQMPEWGFADRRWWVDVNGDGRPDYCRASGASSGSGAYMTCSFLSDAGFTGAYTMHQQLSDWGDPQRMRWTDTDGDGLPEFCRESAIISTGGVDSDTVYTGKLTCTKFFTGSVWNALKSISNGNRKIEVDVTRVLVAPPEGTTYPFSKVAAPVPVVTRYSASNGQSGGMSAYSYSYGGLQVENASAEFPGSGRGLLGFRWMKSVEESTGMETYTEFAQQWPYIGQVVKSETSLVKDGITRLLKRSENALGCYQTNGADPQTGCTPWAAGMVYFPFVVNTAERSWDLDGTQMPLLFSSSRYEGYADQSSTVRQFGDPTQVAVDISQDGVLKHRKVTTNQYLPAKTDGPNWLIGRLARAQVVSSHWEVESGGNPNPYPNPNPTPDPSKPLTNLSNPWMTPVIQLLLGD